MSNLTSADAGQISRPQRYPFGTIFELLESSSDLDPPSPDQLIDLLRARKPADGAGVGKRRLSVRNSQLEGAVTKVRSQLPPP